MYIHRDGEYEPIITADSFRVEEAYNWRGDIMEITRRIVHDTDEARLSNIADHFEVDLSEIREFIEMKHQQKRKPVTHADKIRAMSDEELAEWLEERLTDCPWCSPDAPIKPGTTECELEDCTKCALDWLRREIDDGKN